MVLTGVFLQAALPGPEALPLVLVVAGLVLSIAEALLPGANFIVVGGALLAAGIAGLVFPPLASPLVLGVLVLAFGALTFYAYRELDLTGTEGGRTSDSSSLKGRYGRVTERVTPTEGEVRLDDGGFNPVFAARSLDGEIPEGEEVMVVDPGGGNVLTVESVAGLDGIDRELAEGREREAEGAPPAERDAGGETDGATASAGETAGETDGATTAQGGSEGEPEGEATADGETEREPGRE